MSNRLRMRLFFCLISYKARGFRNFADVTLIILALMYWFNYNRNKYLRTHKTHKLPISKIIRFDDHCFYRLPCRHKDYIFVCWYLSRWMEWSNFSIFCLFYTSIEISFIVLINTTAHVKLLTSIKTCHSINHPVLLISFVEIG